MEELIEKVREFRARSTTKKFRRKKLSELKDRARSNNLEVIHTGSAAKYLDCSAGVQSRVVPDTDVAVLFPTKAFVDASLPLEVGQSFNLFWVDTGSPALHSKFYEDIKSKLLLCCDISDDDPPCVVYTPIMPVSKGGGREFKMEMVPAVRLFVHGEPREPLVLVPDWKVAGKRTDCCAWRVNTALLQLELWRNVGKEMAGHPARDYARLLKYYFRTEKIAISSHVITSHAFNWRRNTPDLHNSSLATFVDFVKQFHDCLKNRSIPEISDPSHAQFTVVGNAFEEISRTDLQNIADFETFLDQPGLTVGDLSKKLNLNK